ncbi:rRNA adenine N-6-methyltransferase family protein [soil metagenome]|nr:methyltransferase [Gemmatimonadota bacterium]
MQTAKHSRSEQALLFARNFFKHPKMLGSLIPSSRFLIDHLTKQIRWDKARVIVEYGPGVGTISQELLRRMNKDAKLVVIEMNADFVEFMRRQFPDPRLHVVHGSAADVDAILARLGLKGADYVLSGIPFSTMPPEVRTSIIDKTRAVLRPKGKFLVYQFSRAVHPHLQQVFSNIRREYEPLNILPAHLYYCSA